MGLKPTYVYFSDDDVFVDHTVAVGDWQRGSATLDYTTAEDYLYIGRYKPFSKLYFDITTPNTATAAMTLEYYDSDDEDWKELTPDSEDTVGFTRSGWLTWTIPDTWEENTVNTVEKYWIRLSFDASFDPAAVINGLGLVFTDDYDLKKKVSNISDYVPTGYTTHILKHVAATEEIVQRIRGEGKYKISVDDGLAEDIDEFDLHRIDQVKQAAVYKCLELIFKQLSNVENDSFWMKALDFEKQYNSAYNTVLLSLDSDDSGFESPAEKTTEGPSCWARVTRA